MMTSRLLGKLMLIFLASGLVFSCGDSKREYPVEQKVSGVTWPTMDSFPRWREIWDGHSWIIALSRQQQSLKSKDVLNNALVLNMANNIAREDKSLQVQNIIPEIRSVLQTHVLAISNFEKTLISGAGPLPVFGFAEVYLRGGLSGLQNLFLMSPVWANKLKALGSTDERDTFMVRWMWDVLETVDGVEFAEPNLESTVQQENSGGTPTLADRMKAQWNTDILALDQLVPAMGKGNTSVVAVVDTGVDSLFDGAGQALEGRFYRNPGEDPEKGAKPFVDDDGNGWVDDYIGVDASVPKGQSDSGPEPFPGSNDVGGQGVPCSREGGEGSQSCGHGTHVAGIIAGGAIASSEYIGVCPLNCKILAIRAAKRCFAPKGTQSLSKDIRCPRQGESTSFDKETQFEVDGGISDSAQLQALAYILDLTVPGNPNLLVTNVVNLSIGKYFSSRALSLMARRLVANDVLMVAAAGNQNVEIPMFPAAYRDVVSVCSTSHDSGDAGSQVDEPTGSSDRKQSSGPVRGRRLKSRFSNFGDWVDICAPGSNIKSSVPGGGFDYKSGTSQASPHVAGLAGLLKAIGSSLLAQDIRTLLVRYSNFELLYGPLSDGTLANADFAFSPYSGIKVFMLGSGMLSAVRPFYALTDPVKAREFVSQADSVLSYGDTSQVTSGCVVSSLASHHPLKKFEAFTSTPFVLLAGWLVLRLIRLYKKRSGSAFS